MRQRSIAALVAVLAMALAVLVPAGDRASAVTGGEFDPGRIISDETFYDEGALGPAQIQDFLNARVPECASRTATPCLKSYSETTNSRPADRYCSGYSGAPNETAATIIYRVAQSCGISPKVLLVTLQKEQAIVTSTAPSPAAYRIAMGYGCPDTAPCDALYYGFFNQVYSAARQFQVYTLNPTLFGFRAGRTENIQYHPNGACGSSPVFIQNQATANLYIYTPYQPNAAALSNLYASGDSCSSYGNLNFWLLFNDWFGSTSVDPGVPSLIRATYADTLGREASGGEVESWTTLVARGYGRNEIASGFLNSQEYRNREISAAYQSVLGRPATEAEITHWTGQYGSLITGSDELVYFISLTPEYVSRANNDPATVVANLYTQMLGRPAGPDEIAFWLAQYPAHGKDSIIFSIWESPEAHGKRINDIYLRYHGRTANAGDIGYWLPIAVQFSDYDVVHGALVSPEYWGRSLARYPV